MQKKTRAIQDKAITLAGEIDLSDGVSDEEARLAGAALRMRQEIPPPTPPANTQGEGVTIVMKRGRAWQLADRVLKPGERVTLDEATARQVVEAGYAEFVE